MKTKLIKSVLFFAIAATLFSFDLPEGWLRRGSKPKSYEMGIDKAAGQDGKNAATIKSKKKKIDGFGTLMQVCKPDKFLGKRVRMSAIVKSENVIDWAGLWLRVDSQGSGEALEFDNMQERPIKGSSNWTRYEIVLDVPANALQLAYGALLSGTGQIWFDNVTFEIVDNSVKTTGKPEETFLKDESENLDFED